MHLTREERADTGRAAREAVPLESLAELRIDDRSDPVELLEAQGATRVPELLPIRYGRMSTTPFAFYRGGALLMATDLARTPSSGLRVQLCGDAHISNFGIFASPERRLVFDISDFDETHPGPFEWDVKRLVASLSIAGGENGFSAKERRKIVLTAAAGYRKAMRTFAGQGNLTVWYTRLDADDVLKRFGRLNKKKAKLTKAASEKARSRDSLQALAKLTTMVDGRPRILSQPPLLVPVEELWGQDAARDAQETLRKLVNSYGRTLQGNRRHLLDQYELTQVAQKVVGVGSVGTRAWILLLEGVDGDDPLFLQAKEAGASVLSGFVKGSRFRNQGQRVVAGQLLMQAASDVFLGWQHAAGADGDERDYYIRQLRDGKLSVEVEDLDPDDFAVYGRLCAQTLARAHARSGDRVAIASYLGSKSRFDDAMVEFAEAYRDLNKRDHKALGRAIGSGRIAAQTGI